VNPERSAPRMRVDVMEGLDILPGPPGGEPDFGEKTLGRHVLFLGAVGTGKTNAIRHLVKALRAAAAQDDVFVFFDTKGDFRRAFGKTQLGDVVLGPGGTRSWNVFADLISDSGRADQVHEIASTIFSDAMDRAGQNAFFAYAARDVFGAVLLAMSRDSQARLSNAALRAQLEQPAAVLRALLIEHEDLAGTARFLDGQAAPSVLAFVQQTASAAFSGGFRQDGDFSVRGFIRAKAGRALFVEYDLAIGSRLLPVYRVLIDMAIKEALEIGRQELSQGPARGKVYFVLDEFALLPALSHLADGINFGRELGLRFIAGSQNVHQVLSSYGPDRGRSILSGFGTVAAFRLMDSASRDLVRQRLGTNRKHITVHAPVRNDRDQHEFVTGNVIEDWYLSELTTGRCVIVPCEGPPFWYAYRRADDAG
jgi:type IV secretory pathway TraG/TraD family ATPase VirD4